MMPPLWLLKLGAILALLVGVWLHGHRVGAAGVQAEWAAQVVADKAAAEAARESDRLRSRAAATSYETQRAAFAARLTKPPPESTYALHATICPPAGALDRPLELGDVPVPGAVLIRLRDAGSDYSGH
jgi:hypothetical protein